MVIFGWIVWGYTNRRGARVMCQKLPKGKQHWLWWRSWCWLQLSNPAGRHALNKVLHVNWPSKQECQKKCKCKYRSEMKRAKLTAIMRELCSWNAKRLACQGYRNYAGRCFALVSTYCPIVVLTFIPSGLCDIIVHYSFLSTVRSKLSDIY